MKPICPFVRKRIRSSALSRTFVLFAALTSLAWFFTAGCDEGGYKDLAGNVKVFKSFGAIGSTSWIRALEGGTTELIVLGGAVEGKVGGITYLVVEPDSATMMYIGSYVAMEGYLNITFDTLYEKPNESNFSFLSRIGSREIELEHPITSYNSYKMEEGVLSIFDGTTNHRFEQVADVVASFEEITENDARMLVRLYNLSVLSAQTRIPRFGGAGVFAYMGSDELFNGALTGNILLSVVNPLSPSIFMSYESYSDMSGSELTGGMEWTTDMAGDGTQKGNMDFSLPLDPQDVFIGLECSLKYDLTLSDGLPIDGTITVKIGEDEWEMSYDILNDMDFSSILPLNPPETEPPEEE